MSIITVFSGVFCNQESNIKTLLDRTGYTQLVDANIVAKASKNSGLSESKISRAFTGKTSVFNQFTHEKERSIAYLRLAAAELLVEDKFLFRGFSSMLIPREISHVLHLCLIADMKSRVAWAKQGQSLSDSEALKIIHKEDEDRGIWIDALFLKKDPWDPSLYDIMIPTDKLNSAEIAALVEKNLNRDIVQPSPQSRQAAHDFLLAAQAGVALAREGHNVGVSARQGVLTLTINKHVLMLSRLEDELPWNPRSVRGSIRPISTESSTLQSPPRSCWSMTSGNSCRPFRKGCCCGKWVRRWFMTGNPPCLWSRRMNRK
jgi:hypothetical protein